MKPIIESEMHNLREELRDLKGYQFKLLSIAATITGFLLSLTRVRIESAEGSPGPSLYLLPLVVILPSWCIFFDKARTITRIVGYYRIAEKALRREPEPSPAQFPGWENSLGLFRKRRQDVAHELASTRKVNLGKRIARFPLAALLIGSQEYWVLTYYTFLALSVVCLSIPLQSHALRNILQPHIWTSEGLFLGLATILVIVIAVFNGVILSRLIWGEHSYDQVEIIWKRILNWQEDQESSGPLAATPSAPDSPSPLSHVAKAPH
jgi:hypothetical protein